MDKPEIKAVAFVDNWDDLNDKTKWHKLPVDGEPKKPNTVTFTLRPPTESPWEKILKNSKKGLYDTRTGILTDVETGNMSVLGPIKLNDSQG